MRFILIDNSDDVRRNFFPLALSRPLWELRCGMMTLEEKLTAKINATLVSAKQAGAGDVAYFVPQYMAEAYRARVSPSRRVNDMSALAGDDLIVIDPLVKPEGLDIPRGGKSEVGVDKQGRVLYARISKNDLPELKTQDSGLKTQNSRLKTQDSGVLNEFLASAKAKLPNVPCGLGTWRHIWDLILANSEQIKADFAAADRSGIEGTVEQPGAILGSKKDVYVAPKARVQPMVVIDAENGPVYIDEGADIQPFTRIEGPCYIGKDSILFGAKCREASTIGPSCRIGGEVEASIIQGYSNKYHDGFIGHSYVGEWVNLGALTSNSDLKNDYSPVSVTMEGRKSIDTGSTKLGSLIGDHTKCSIGTLLNTGSYIGTMAMIMATGKLLPKLIPSFAWFVGGVVTKGFGRARLYQTAKAVMSRRKCKWTGAQQAMWDAVFEMTAPERNEAIRRGRRAMLK